MTPEITFEERISLLSSHIEHLILFSSLGSMGADVNLRKSFDWPVTTLLSCCKIQTLSSIQQRPEAPPVSTSMLILGLPNQVQNLASPTVHRSQRHRRQIAVTKNRLTKLLNAMIVMQPCEVLSRILIRHNYRLIQCFAQSVEAVKRVKHVKSTVSA